MGHKDVIRVTDAQPLALVDETGLLTHQHIAAGPYLRFADGAAGELLLCGAAIRYDLHTGTLPGAPMCKACEERDG